MKQTDYQGVPISVLSLGTAQLGINYGINNQSGKPDRSAAFEILNTAVKVGITALDTAAAYGDAEITIGEWMKTISPANCPFVMTKAKALDHSSLDNLRKSLREQVEASKARLGLEQIPLLMLHSCDEYLGDEANVRLVFDELKASGDIRFGGISAYAHHDYGEIAASGFDAVQIPINIFDWRQIESGGMQKLRASGMMIFVRSVYLQGLVFQDPDALDPRMVFCRETLVKFRALCAAYNLRPAQLALSFALSLPGITSLVLGSEKAEQVCQNAALLEETVQLTAAQLEEIHTCFRDTDYHVLTPTTWYNA